MAVEGPASERRCSEKLGRLRVRGSCRAVCEVQPEELPGCERARSRTQKKDFEGASSAFVCLTLFPKKVKMMAKLIKILTPFLGFVNDFQQNAIA